MKQMKREFLPLGCASAPSSGLASASASVLVASVVSASSPLVVFLDFLDFFLSAFEEAASVEASVSLLLDFFFFFLGASSAATSPFPFVVGAVPFVAGAGVSASSSSSERLRFLSFFSFF